MVTYATSGYPPCNSSATCLMCDWRWFWYLFLSTCCVVFLNALCSTINCNYGFIWIGILKVLFSVTLTLLMQRKLAGCCFDGERHSWSVWPKAVECQVWNHAKSGMKQGCFKTSQRTAKTRLCRSFPFKVKKLILNWKLPHFLHKYLLWPQMQTSFCFVFINDHLRWIIWNSI